MAEFRSCFKVESTRISDELSTMKKESKMNVRCPMKKWQSEVIINQDGGNAYEEGFLEDTGRPSKFNLNISV